MMLRRTSVAVPSRLVEGCARANDRDFAVDLHKAAASCNELEYLVLLAHDLDLFNVTDSDEMIAATAEVRKMIFGLLRKM